MRGCGLRDCIVTGGLKEPPRTKKCVGWNSSELDPPQIGDRPLVIFVAGVHRGLRLQQQDLYRVFGDGQMLDAAGHDYELAGFEADVTIAKLDHKTAVHHEKQFVLVLVTMPDK